VKILQKVLGGGYFFLTHTVYSENLFIICLAVMIDTVREWRTESCRNIGTWLCTSVAKWNSHAQFSKTYQPYNMETGTGATVYL